jgi:hypothetical protein
MISAWKRANIQRTFDSDPNYTRCAKDCHVDPKTVHKYTDKDVVPKRTTQREYRTRTAPLDEFWPEIKVLLENDPKLKPYAILEFLLDKYPTQFDPSWRRTLERRMGRWAIENQIAKDVTFSQIHQPGDVLAFDFTELASLNITVASAQWSGLLFHATLTYSNWEYAELCLSESYEAVVSGVQNAFLELGGVTRRLRCDSLTAAVNNHNSKHNFQVRYSSFLEHFGVVGHRINVNKPQENGDCESSHGHLKDYLDQQLRLRGNRNFETLDDLRTFIAEKTRKRNAKRSDQLVRDRAALKPLPPSQFPTFTQVDVLVPSTSVIRIKQNAYSIPSHLINLKLQSRIHADHIALWYQGRKLLEMPRLIGSKQVSFDFRDVIDSLVRKPGGFANYRYREHMYPTDTFRKGFDTAIAQHGEPAGIRCYLKLLHMAKHHGQINVEAELSRVLDSGETFDLKAIELKVKPTSPASLVEDPHIEQPELDEYDDLLEHKEVLDEPDKHTDDGSNETATEPRGTGWPFEAIETSDDAIHGDWLSGSSIAGGLEPSSVFGRSVDSGDGEAKRESHITSDETVGTGMQHDMVSDQVVEIPDGSTTSNATTSERGVREASGEFVNFRQAGLGEDDVTKSVGQRTGEVRVLCVLRPLCETSPASVACQTRTSIAGDAEEAWSLFSVDHRRYRVRTTESRRDGSIVYIDCGSIRAHESADQQQPSILEMGADLQGPHDNGSSHRPIGSPQHDSRAEREQLSIGGSSGKTTSNDDARTPEARLEIHGNPVRNFSCR